MKDTSRVGDIKSSLKRFLRFICFAFLEETNGYEILSLREQWRLSKIVKIQERYRLRITILFENFASLNELVVKRRWDRNRFYYERQYGLCHNEIGWGWVTMKSRSKRREGRHLQARQIHWQLRGTCPCNEKLPPWDQEQQKMWSFALREIFATYSLGRWTVKNNAEYSERPRFRATVEYLEESLMAYKVKHLKSKINGKNRKRWWEDGWNSVHLQTDAPSRELKWWSLTVRANLKRYWREEIRFEKSSYASGESDFSRREKVLMASLSFCEWICASTSFVLSLTISLRVKKGFQKLRTNQPRHQLERLSQRFLGISQGGVWLSDRYLTIRTKPQMFLSPPSRMNWSALSISGRLKALLYPSEGSRTRGREMERPHKGERTLGASLGRTNAFSAAFMIQWKRGRAWESWEDHENECRVWAFQVSTSRFEKSWEHLLFQCLRIHDSPLSLLQRASDAISSTCTPLRRETNLLVRRVSIQSRFWDQWHPPLAYSGYLSSSLLFSSLSLLYQLYPPHSSLLSPLSSSYLTN